MAVNWMQNTPLEPVSLQVDQSAPERTIGPITRTDIVRYAAAGGDFNPIHHDEEFAKSAGMRTVFAMGLMQGGFLASYAAHWLGRPNVRTLKLRYAAQVWPGDLLTLSGKVDSISNEGGKRLAVCSLEVTRQTGEVAIKATATAHVAAAEGEGAP
jgi:acyl dehydratase